MVSWKVQNPPDPGKVPTHWAFLRSVVQANPELGDPAKSTVLIGKLMENSGWGSGTPIWFSGKPPF